MLTPATSLTPGDAYQVGPDTYTVTAAPFPDDGLLGAVLCIPVTVRGDEVRDVVHPDHQVNKS
ncbi:hypothetical protein Q7689_00475 [Nocardiopsis tropica]|uniref:hypothetical protein n=1 Tax=Nocardiopsis tropica TaxID=109330 RepID=UPI002E8AF197|nr:hypothetical protein [Nocardiopsis tropica]